MSKSTTESGRKLFQPIPLSSILDPTYQSPFSKLQQFQVDVDISSEPRSGTKTSKTTTTSGPSSVWHKLQTSLVNAMSNLAVISANHPIFTNNKTPVISYSTCSAAMSLVPWRNFKTCEENLHQLVSQSQSDPDLTTSSGNGNGKDQEIRENPSIYYSIRSGLEYLRYFATHPLTCEEVIRKQQKGQSQGHQPHHHHHNCKQSELIGEGQSQNQGGALFLPLSVSLLSSSSSQSKIPSFSSASEPATPDHCNSSFLRSLNLLGVGGHEGLEGPENNLFCLAMSGQLFLAGAQSLHYKWPSTSRLNNILNLNRFYKNCYLFNQGQRSLSVPSTPQKGKGELEIVIHSSTQIVPFGRSQCQSQSHHLSPIKSPMSMPKSRLEGGTCSASSSGGPGCIVIEANWKSSKGSKMEGRSKTNGGGGGGGASICSMSLCTSSSSPPTKCTKSGGVGVTMATTTTTTACIPIPRRNRTESETSTDSFIEFSASVESADSFCIVFEPVGEEEGRKRGGYENSSEDEVDLDVDDDDDDEWEEDFEKDDGDSGDDEDKVFNYNYSPSTTDEMFVGALVFQPEGIEEDDNHVDKVVGGGGGEDQVDLSNFCLPIKKSKKNVSFNEEQLANVIVFEDDEDSQSSRKNYWEMLARDRYRFQDTIQRMADVLDPILEEGHREKVFQQRFNNLDG